MIKISRSEHENGKVVELKIEGKITGAWAEELRQACVAILRGRAKRLILDFSSVTSIDRDGLQLFKKADCSRIKIVGCNLFLRDLVGNSKLKRCLVDAEAAKGWKVV